MAPSTLQVITGALCFLATASEIAVVALIVNIITKSIPVESSIYAIALTAAIAHVLDVVFLLATTTDYLRQAAGLLRTIFSSTSILLATLSSVLSVYTFVHLYRGTGANEDIIQVQCRGGFVVWTLTVIAHAALYTIFFAASSDRRVDDNSVEEGNDKASPVRSLKRSISVHLASLTPPPTAHFGDARPASPIQSTNHASPRSSVQYSMDHVIRPMTSRTKLLLRKARDSYSLHSERKHSLDTIGQEDDFGDWDTSAPDDIPVETNRAQPRNRLETIPGSRPVSPARPLDGPFQNEEEQVLHATAEQRRRDNEPLVVTSPSSDSSSLRHSSRSWEQQPPDQSMIHPLFRSDSPSPAPVVSPGSNVYASPLGGRTISPDNDIWIPRRLHSAHSNRAESPSPLLAGRSRQNSFQSMRYQQTATFDPMEQIPPSPSRVGPPGKS